MIFIFYGAEGSGKSTHAKFLSEKLSLSYVSSGAMFREEYTKGSSVGLIYEEWVVKKRKYVPDEPTNKLILERLSQPDCEHGFVMEGYPRTLNQLETLDRFLAEKNKKIDRVVYITLPEEVAIKRLMARGRADDTPERIKERLESYREGAKDLLKVYQDRNILVEISNLPPVDQVQEEILVKLGLE
ncbi:MAG: nucleoside monophosphate kinase [Patescibacteria group bacterium]|nr:nucleoside monophosphate kinase [Patescibacteria group bacterium]